METPSLFEYGIQHEKGVIRAHVGVLACKVYAFRAERAAAILDNYPALPAYQNGVKGATASGRAVPCRDIPGLRVIKFKSEWATIFKETDETSDKGKCAVAIVTRLLRDARFPLPCSNNDMFNVNGVRMQIEGDDIVVDGHWRIQVKCDYRAGDGHPRCTGNLYLQTHERNPLHRI